MTFANPVASVLSPSAIAPAQTSKTCTKRPASIAVPHRRSTSLGGLLDDLVCDDLEAEPRVATVAERVASIEKAVEPEKPTRGWVPVEFGPQEPLVAAPVARMSAPNPAPLPLPPLSAGEVDDADPNHPRYGDCPPEVDRSQPVYSARAQRAFPAPDRFDNMGSPENSDVARLLASAPWLYPNVLREVNVINCYVQDGMLPGRLPVVALTTRVFHGVLAAADVALWRGRNTTMLDARANYVRLVYRHLRRYRGPTWLDPHWDFDIWRPRYALEGDYARRLSELSGDLLDEFAEGELVRQDALLLTRSLFPAHFRYLRKRLFESFSEHSRNERRLRSLTGYLIPYQHCEISALNTRGRYQRYIAIFPLWQDLEVPRGFHSELPSVLTLCQNQLYHSGNSGWWTVFYTEHVARVAAFLLWDLYDNYRVWALSPRVIALIRSLDLTYVLGGRQNFEEVLAILDLIERTEWSEVDEANRNRGDTRQDHSPGRVGPGGDFIWCEPGTLRLLDREEALSRAAAGPPGEHRPIPAGHPTHHAPVPVHGLGWGAGASAQPATSPARSDPPGAGVDLDEEIEPAGPPSPQPSAGGWVPQSPGPGGSRTPARATTPARTPSPRVGDRRGRSRSPGGYEEVPRRPARGQAGPSTPGAGPSSAAAPAASSATAQLTPADRLAVIKDFLRSADFDDEEVRGDQAELRGFVRALKRAHR